MISILSIDFDYFLDITAEEREHFFPDGSDEIPAERLDELWQEKYNRFPKLKEVGLIEDYDLVKNLLSSYDFMEEDIRISETHKDIRNMIDMIPKYEYIRIVNVDFHHDYYHYYTGGDNYNCGNWLRRLVEERPDTQIKWIRREDSQIFSLEGRIPFEHTIDIATLENEDFDLLFMCRSPEWSPPHLVNKFYELVNSTKKSYGAV